MKQKILILGATGTLGSNIFFYLKKNYEIILNVNQKNFFCSGASYCNLSSEDFNSKKIIFDKIKNISPDIIINCIANTNVDYCEKFPKITNYSNNIIPKKISQICRELSIRFIHISTDHLYDGKDKIKKDELFEVKPINNYAKQKYYAEKNIIKNNPNTLIIRTNFFGFDNLQKQFIDYVFNNIQNNKKIDLYDDYLFTPISTKFFSKCLDLLIKKKIKGIINVVSSEIVSKYDFGFKILKILNHDAEIINKKKS